MVGLPGRQGPRGAHRATRGADGSAAAEATRTAVAERRMVRSADRWDT